MIKSSEIKYPLIIDFPVSGRMLYPYSYIRNIVFFILILILIPNIVLFIGGDTRFDTYLSSSFSMTGVLVVFFILFKFLIKKYFIGSILNDGTEFIHIHPKFSGKGTISYKFNSIENIIFEKLGPKNEFLLYLVDHAGKKHVIIDKFLMVIGDKDIDHFLSKLSEVTGFPVKKV